MSDTEEEGFSLTLTIIAAVIMIIIVLAILAVIGALPQLKPQVT
jgi:Tfp pilus assembly protein PilV